MKYEKITTAHSKKRVIAAQKENSNIFVNSKLLPNIHILVQKKSIRLGTTLILFLVLFFSYFANTKFANEAQFGFDQWEYQSMAVNFAKGHGINKFGCIENFEVYKFGFFDQSYNGTMEHFVNSAGSDNFYRTPGYPIYLGIIYKFFGVSPQIAGKVNMLFLILIFSFLPMIGFHYWKTTGFFAGLLSGFFSFKYHNMFSGSIMTESLITIVLFFIIISYIYFETKNSIISSILLGGILGIGLLVKGSLIFLPFLVVAFLLYKYFKSKDKKIIRNTIVISFACAMIVLPWSIYASTKSGKTIILSTQGENVLLDGNNEYATGGWQPDWRNHKESFYNNDGMNKSSTFLRVMNFYYHNPAKFPILMAQKLVYGFIPFAYLMVILILLFSESVIGILGKKMNKTAFILFNLFVIAPLLLVVLYQWNFSYTEFYDGIKGKEFLFAFLLLIPVVAYFIKQKVVKEESYRIIKFPEIFIIIIANLVFVNLLINGEIFGRGNRFVEIINFLFIFISLQYAFNYCRFCYQKLNSKN